MPHGDKTKSLAFKLWYQGKALVEIQEKVKIASARGRSQGTKPGSVSGWVKDWDRGDQKVWVPRPRQSN